MRNPSAGRRVKIPRGHGPVGSEVRDPDHQLGERLSRFGILDLFRHRGGGKLRRIRCPGFFVPGSDCDPLGRPDCIRRSALYRSGSIKGRVRCLRRVGEPISRGASSDQKKRGASDQQSIGDFHGSVPFSSSQGSFRRNPVDVPLGRAEISSGRGFPIRAGD